MSDLLNSHYIIDGVHQALSPAQMLRDCTMEPPLPPDGDPSTIADEHMELPSPTTFQAQAPSESLLEFKRRFPIQYPASFTVGKLAQSLLDAVWMVGHFRLGDLNLKAEWRWNDSKIGYPAAFYDSVEAACGFLDALGVKISVYNVLGGGPSVSFKATTVAEEDAPDEEESLFRELPYRTANPRISRRRKCPSTLVPEEQDWLIYIPFDSCDFRLGGSALEEATGKSDATAPDLGDADYFIDCYEVLRELVEDGVVKAGATVGDGGLMTALEAMCQGGCGARVSVRDIGTSMDEKEPLRILYGEIPGVVIQISGSDYDYVDAEFLLQDVVWFPIGHPVPGGKDVTIEEKTDIQGILSSLLNTLEGED